MQIALTIDISHDTTRRYQRMNEKEFEELIYSKVADNVPDYTPLPPLQIDCIADLTGQYRCDKYN